MKSRIFVLATFLLTLTAFAVTNFFDAADKWRKKYRTEPGEPMMAIYARALHESPATNGVIQIYDDETDAIRDLTGADLPFEPFVATATLTSAAAATPISLLADSRVPAGRKVYITGFHAKVSGATNWATTATVKIQDTNSSAVDYFTAAVAALTGNAEVRPGVSNITSENAYLLGTGGTAAKGLQLKGNANGTGSDLVVTVYGIIK